MKGTAMGTRMAPSYANLFMGLFESRFLSKQKLKPLKWFRFIDDIFFIWQHGVESLNEFLNNLNSSSTLNFTWKYSKENITFLDVDVFVESGFIKTKIHIKETNTMKYLNYASCHPTYVKKSIPKSLSLRAKGLCSNEQDFNTYVNKLTRTFTSLGYPDKIIRNQINKPKNPPQNNKGISKNDPKFITTFYPGLNKLNNVIKTALPLLQSSTETKKLFSKPPRVTFRNPPNLKNLLVKTDLSNCNKNNSFHSGCKPCQKPRCGTCKIIASTSNFQSNVTKKQYPIKGEINCNTTNVIYQLNCNFCDKQYIGQTSNPLRIRMTGHRFSVKHEQHEKPIAKHAFEHKQVKFEDCFNLKGV